MYNIETVNVKIPASFKWVIDQMLEWKEEQKTGKFIFNFKYGGIQELEKQEKEFPPKSNCG